MNRTAAIKMYASLMWEHGLIQEGWKPKLNSRSKCRLGACHYRNKTLDISVWHVDNGTDEAIKDTMLHEIAHAIAGHRAGHGPDWQAVCRRIGAKPEQYAGEEDSNKNLPWRLAVRNEDGTITPLSRIGARRTDVSRKMVRGKPETLGRLIWIENK